MAEALTLASPLGRWEVVLHSGDKILIRAHGVKEYPDRLVFVALMDAHPPYEAEICSLPRAAVSDIAGA